MSFRPFLKNDNYYLATYKQNLKKKQQEQKRKQKIREASLKIKQKEKQKLQGQREKTQKNEQKQQVDSKDEYKNSDQNKGRYTSANQYFTFSVPGKMNRLEKQRQDQLEDLLAIVKKKKLNKVKDQNTNTNKNQSEKKPNSNNQSLQSTQRQQEKNQNKQNNIRVVKNKSEEQQEQDILVKLQNYKKENKQGQNNKHKNRPLNLNGVLFKPQSELVIKDKIAKNQKTQQQCKRQKTQEQYKQKKALKKLQYEAKAKNTPYNNQKTQQSNKNNVTNQSQSESGQKQKKQKKNKSQKKKIKKVNNYQRLDLKRKFKDRFVGGIRENQRKYMKNGALKFKYRTAQSQLQVTDGELYNTFIHSLSKAFHVNVSLESSDSDNQSIPQKVKEQIQIPKSSESTKSRLQILIKDLFGFEHFRQGQFEVIQNVLNNKSTIFVSQTASGKSLTYIISSIIMAQQHDGLAIVVSPLIALMLDQLEHLPEQLPAACISSLLNFEQRDRILDLIRQKKVKLLFLTPETLMSDLLFHVKSFPPINFVCIDQAHCLSQLSHNFRISYLALSEIILNQITYKNLQPNILCLTATANDETIQSLQKKLKIKEVIKSSSTLNKNLYITISRENSLNDKLKELVNYFSQPQISRCQGALVYCKAKYLIDKVFNYLTNSGIAAFIFHGSLSNKQKTDIISKFKTQQIKIIITTTALGMGLDFQHLDCIVHFNMPKSLQSYVQEIGRAGRRSTRAYCHLFLDENDFLMERNYILADQLEFQSLKVIVDEIRKSRLYLTGKRNQKTSKNKSLQQSKKEKQKHDQIIRREQIQIEKMEQSNLHDSKQSQNQYCEPISQNIQDSLLYHGQNSQKQKLSEVKSSLYFLRVKQLVEKTFLREEALLTILIKMAEQINQQLNNKSESQKEQSFLKVLPLSHEVLKLAFFKKNQVQLIKSQKNGQFYKELIDFDRIVEVGEDNEGKTTKGGKKKTQVKAGCRKVNGVYHINLIKKCNQLKLSPIKLLSKVYQISNLYTMKVQFLTDIYVLKITQTFEINFAKIYELIVSRIFQINLIEQVNKIQLTSMKKLNVLYSLAFNFSQISVTQLIKKKMLISRNQKLPKDNIMDQITKYFRSDLDKFYQDITEATDQDEKQMYLPTELVMKDQYDSIFDLIGAFFKHQFSVLRDIRDINQLINKKRETLEKFKDGKVITRVFLGVNQEKSSRKIYGEHNYWRRYIKKKYTSMLHVVRWLIQDNFQNFLTY